MVHDSILAEWCRQAERSIERERSAGFDRAGHVQPTDPTPAEIASRAAAIRAGWSEAERAKRLRVDWRPQDVNLPTGADDELRHSWLLMG